MNKAQENSLHNLQGLGFSRKQALVYLTLLTFRELSSSIIAKKTGLKRPTIYKILEELTEKSCITTIKKNNVLHFKAIPHQELIRLFSEKNTKEKSCIEMLNSDLKAIETQHEKIAAEPQMSIYQGTEGLIQVMEDTLTTKEEILCWADIKSATQSLKAYYPTYIQKKITRKINLRGIFCEDEVAHAFKKRGKKELREVKIIDKSKFPFENEICIYENKVAILSHEDKVGIIIQNQHIANTQRLIFELAWDNL